MESTKPVWEQYGITLEDYARAFTKVMNEMYESTKCGGFNVISIKGFPENTALLVDKERRVMRICNINV